MFEKYLRLFFSSLNFIMKLHIFRKTEQKRHDDDDDMEKWIDDNK
jgi:hypothetical protein